MRGKKLIKVQKKSYERSIRVCVVCGAGLNPTASRFMSIEWWYPLLTNLHLCHYRVKGEGVPLCHLLLNLASVLTASIYLHNKHRYRAIGHVYIVPSLVYYKEGSWGEEGGNSWCTPTMHGISMYTFLYTDTSSFTPILIALKLDRALVSDLPTKYSTSRQITPERAYHCHTYLRIGRRDITYIYTYTVYTYTMYLHIYVHCIYIYYVPTHIRTLYIHIICTYTFTYTAMGQHCSLNHLTTGVVILITNNWSSDTVH